MTIKATVFNRPNGKKEIIELSNIYDGDAEYINQNNIKVSLEQISYNNIVIYFDYGKTVNDEPDEYMELSLGKSCKDTIQSGINKLKQLVVDDK